MRQKATGRNMQKNILAGVLCALVFVIHDFAEAQQAGKVHRIGFLDFRFRSITTDPRFVGFREGLRELGYIEGQNIIIEYLSVKGKRERIPEIAAELLALKPDIIVTAGSLLVWRAAKQATRIIPIVLAGGTNDPVEAGIVESLARPGGNITGLTNREVDLHGKRLALLKESFPGISRVTVIWTPTQQKQAITEVNALRKALSIQIESVVVEPPLNLPSLEKAFSAISQQRPDALLLTSSALTLRHRRRVVEFAAKLRLPTIYGSELFVQSGGLMSYGVDSTESYRRAATYVDKILRGANPGELPIEQPRKFEFVINLKTAKQIGVTIPPNVLVRATEVIR